VSSPYLRGDMRLGYRVMTGSWSTMIRHHHLGNMEKGGI
jgi:hypothetical protein